MTSSESTLQSHAAASQGLMARWWALGAAVVVLVMIYAVWPYQHWMFATRGSVIEGWVRWIALEPEWHFCFAVPVIVGFLVCRQRAELAALPLEGTWLGLPVMVFSLILFWIGYKVDTGYLGYASAQLMVAGLILMLGGRAWWRALLLPWMFLLFAWPMHPLEGMLATPLRAITAKVAGGILNTIGIPVVRYGTGLFSAPDFILGVQQGDLFQLDVANPCSGIRSLFSLMMIAALYGCLAMKRTLPRLLLLACAIPLAVVGNLVRLVLLALGSVWFGQTFAIGKTINGSQEESAYHLLCGYLVFAIALGGMFAIATALEGRKHWNRVKLWNGSRKSESGNATLQSGSQTHLRSAVCVGLAALALVVCAFTPTAVTYAEPGLLLQLPATVDGYNAKMMSMDANEKRLFDEGVKLERALYESANLYSITATLVMSGPVKKSLHEPTLCLPNQGWTIANSEGISFKLPDGRLQHATLMHIFRDQEVAPGQRMRIQALNVYWYQGSHGVSTAGYNMSYTRSYLDAIFRNLNHRWGQVAFYMPFSQHPVGNDDPLEEVVAREQMLKFLEKLTPQILVEFAK